MEKRKSTRVRKRVMLDINNKPAILVDISKNGVRVSTGMPPTTRRVKIIIRVDEQTFDLNGTVRWVKRKVALQKLYDMGLSIEGAPEGFDKFIDKLKTGS
jgi:hypothetical protein